MADERTRKTERVRHLVQLTQLELAGCGGCPESVTARLDRALGLLDELLGVEPRHPKEPSPAADDDG